MRHRISIVCNIIQQLNIMPSLRHIVREKSKLQEYIHTYIYYTDIYMYISHGSSRDTQSVGNIHQELH